MNPNKINLIMCFLIFMNIVLSSILGFWFGVDILIVSLLPIFLFIIIAWFNSDRNLDQDANHGGNE